MTLPQPPITPHPVLPQQTWADQYLRLERALEAADVDYVAGVHYEDALMAVFIHALALRDWLLAERLGADGQPEPAWKERVEDLFKKSRMLQRARDLANGAKHKVLNRLPHIHGTRKSAEMWVFPAMPASVRPPLTEITYRFKDGPDGADDEIEGYILARLAVQEWRDLLTGELAVDLRLPRSEFGYELPVRALEDDSGSLAHIRRLLLLAQDGLRCVATSPADRERWLLSVQQIERDLMALEKAPVADTEGDSAGALDPPGPRHRSEHSGDFPKTSEQ